MGMASRVSAPVQLMASSELALSEAPAIRRSAQEPASLQERRGLPRGPEAVRRAEHPEQQVLPGR